MRKGRNGGLVFDGSITAGNILTLVTILVTFLGWAVKAGGDFKVLKEQVAGISTKLDAFVTKDVIQEKVATAEVEHRILHEQIAELRQEVGVLRNGRARR